MSQPAFILFKPQLGENIGATARAMSNFGLVDLRIVAPRDGWPNPDAEAMAAHGAGVLEQASVFEMLSDALHDITYLVATTARSRAMDKPVLTPREFVAQLHQPPSTNHHSPKHAVLFGPERSGLSNEEIVLADAVVTIPVSDENPSLNLAQSAVVMAYEWFCQNGNKDTRSEPALSARSATPCEGASKKELDGFFDHLKPLLDEVGYFREPSREESMWLTLRHIFTRRQMTSQEVQTLRGVVRAICKSCGLPTR